MQFNISFKTIFEYILKKLVLCIQIHFVSTEKTTRIASRASCLLLGLCVSSTSLNGYSPCCPALVSANTTSVSLIIVYKTYRPHKQVMNYFRYFYNNNISNFTIYMYTAVHFVCFIVAGIVIGTMYVVRLWRTSQYERNYLTC